MGLKVSPSGISDNIFRVMAPGTRSRIEVESLTIIPAGRIWYHPHVHDAATYQFVSGMAGFLIIKGGPGTLDDLPEIKAAKDLVMGFQVIRADPQGEVPGVNEQATQFGTFPFGTEDPSSARRVEHLRLGRRSGAEQFLLHHQRRHQPHLAHAIPARCNGGGCSLARRVRTCCSRCKSMD